MDKIVRKVKNLPDQQRETQDFWLAGFIDGAMRTSVISRRDLIRNKLASGREQDLLDVQQLQSNDTAP